MDELSEKAVKAALRTRWVGQIYRYYETSNSTNDRLKEMLATEEGRTLPAGTVLLADYQSHGRGRLERRWQAPPGTSLLVSVLFRPNWPGQQAYWLTMIASLAAAEAVETVTGLPVQVKWPNDLALEVNGRWHKVGGLLLEGNMAADRLASAIVGMGLNVNIAAAELAAMSPAAMTPTSLLAATKQTVSRQALLIAYLERLEAIYEAAGRGDSPQPAWGQRLILIGRQVQVSNRGQESPLVGVAEGTDAWGQLLVRDNRGILHTIVAGDVSLRDPDWA